MARFLSFCRALTFIIACVFNAHANGCYLPLTFERARSSHTPYKSDRIPQLTLYYESSKKDCPQISYQERQRIFNKTPEGLTNALLDLRILAYEEIRDDLRKLDCYDEFMLWLSNWIGNNKNFIVDGFSYKFRPGKIKNSFYDFVHDEAKLIKEKRAHQATLPRLSLSADGVLQELQTEIASAYTFHDKVITIRYAQRKNALKAYALDQTPFDYAQYVTINAPHIPHADVFSNYYGTALDLQLHQELSQTRCLMKTLQNELPDFQPVQTIAPVVYYFTALAKTHSSPEVAFHLSDFCYHLTKASHVIATGVKQGIINTFDHNVTFLKSLATHPIDDVAKPLLQAGASLGKALYQALVLATTDQPQFLAKARSACSKISHYITNNPEDCIALVIEQLISTRASSLINQTQPVINAIKAQEKLISALQKSSSSISRLATPIKETLSEAATIARVGLEHGKKAIANVISVAQEQIIPTPVGEIGAFKISPKSFHDSKALAAEFASLKSAEFIKKKIDQIRRISDDILDTMEAAGGHTLSRHVSITNNELLQRLSKAKNINASSTFPDKYTAISCVKENLRNNAREIATWLETNPTTEKMFEVQHNYLIGRGIKKGKNSSVELTKSRIILAPSKSNNLGFIILTAFPTGA